MNKSINFFQKQNITDPKFLNGSVYLKMYHLFTKQLASYC